MVQPPLLEATGSVALISGAGGGIGRATVELFQAAGARVVAFDRDAARLPASSGSVLAIAGDATDEHAVREPRPRPGEREGVAVPKLHAEPQREGGGQRGEQQRRGDVLAPAPAGHRARRDEHGDRGAPLDHRGVPRGDHAGGVEARPLQATQGSSGQDAVDRVLGAQRPHHADQRQEPQLDEQRHPGAVGACGAGLGGAGGLKTSRPEP